MIKIICLLSLIVVIQSICHIFEKGTYSQFNVLVNSNFVCYNGASFQGTITFQESFPDIPKIMISYFSYKHDKDASYKFQILTQTTTSWTFQIECFHSSAQVQKYEFSWIAVIDDRLFVINELMATTQLITGTQKQYLLPFPDYQYTFGVKLVSYAGGEANIQCSQRGGYVVVNIVSGQIGVGAQIIGGPDDCLNMYFGYTTRSFSDANYVLIYYKSGFYPIYNIYSMLDIYGTTVRELQFVDITLANGSIALTTQGQGGGVYNFYTLVYYQLSIQPHYYKKIRVSKKQNADYRNYVQFNFQQLNLTLNAYKDEQSDQFLNFKGQSLNFIYQYRCQPGYKIVGNVLMISNTYFNFVEFCNKSFDLLTIYIYLYEESQTNRDLQFELNKSGATIYQTITSIPVECSFNKFTLVTLEILRQ